MLIAINQAKILPVKVKEEPQQRRVTRFAMNASVKSWNNQASPQLGQIVEEHDDDEVVLPRRHEKKRQRFQATLAKQEKSQ